MAPPSVAKHKNTPQRKKTVIGRLAVLALDAAVSESSGVLDERRVAPAAGATSAKQHHAGDDESSSSVLGPAGNSPLVPPSSPLVSSPDLPPEVRRGVTAKDLNLYLAETKTSLIRHAASSTGEGVAGAVSSGLVIVPVRMFLEFVATKFHIDRDFLYMLAAMFAFEVVCMVTFRKSAAYRNRTLFAKWPCFFLLAILLVLATGGKTGMASIPLDMLVWTLALGSCWFYEHCKGISKETFWTNFVENCVLVIVLTGIYSLPSFAVLIPVKYLASNYPYWNIVVSGFGLPAFIVVLRKATITFMTNHLQGCVERGELSLDKLMSAHAKLSKSAAVCMTLANVVVMYLSKTLTSCVISAVLSIATEVGCKLYVVWMTRAIVKEQFLQNATAGLKQVVVEPGVQRGAEDDGSVNWKERALAAEERVSVLARKNNVLKELLRQNKLKYGEVVEQEEAEEQDREENVSVQNEGDTTSEEKSEKNWVFVLTMLAARWEKEMAAEKSCILFAAFLIYLFELSDMPSVDLATVCAIFFVSEIVTDTILVYVLDRFFYMPILRLHHRQWEEFVEELGISTAIAMGVALNLSVVDRIVNV